MDECPIIPLDIGLHISKVISVVGTPKIADNKRQSLNIEPDVFFPNGSL